MTWTPSADEAAVLRSVAYLSSSGRTTNTSQVAADAELPRTRVAKILGELEARHLVHDVSPNTAYHWRLTERGKSI